MTLAPSKLAHTNVGKLLPVEVNFENNKFNFSQNQCLVQFLDNTHESENISEMKFVLFVYPMNDDIFVWKRKSTSGLSSSFILTKEFGEEERTEKLKRKNY